MIKTYDRKSANNGRNLNDAISIAIKLKEQGKLSIFRLQRLSKCSYKRAVLIIEATNKDDL